MKPKRHSEYDLKQDLERIKNAFADAASDVKDRATEVLHESIGSVKDKSADLRDSFGNYTKERPFKTVGIAFLAGVVIGLLIHRK
ncbi:MAG: DUF883 family protein [Gammaproteobacteria bacterium]